jgi:hypothetical protein
VRDPDVNSGDVALSASDAPAHSTHDTPDSISLANKRTATVSFARVFSGLSSSANEAWVEHVIVAQSGLSQLVLTRVLLNNRHINFLENILILSIFPVVLAPTADEIKLNNELLLLFLDSYPVVQQRCLV